MLDKNTKISVTNRDSGPVCYLVQSDTGSNIKREFAPGQTREIDFGELQSLYWTKGGKVMLEEILRINNQEAINELMGKVEPEYNYSASDVRRLLLEGSLDELKDCLDFAPSGVVDLVREFAVSMEIDSESKRKAITDKTGFDVGKAIEINRQVREEEQKNQAEPTVARLGERRVQPKEVNDTPTKRRTEAPKYTPIGK